MLERGTGQRTGANRKLRQRQRGIQVHVLSYMYRCTGSYIYTFIYVCGRLEGGGGGRGEGKFSGQEGGFNPLSATAA